jgi:5-formyltetrahydrofolate cyclo-ligase
MNVADEKAAARADATARRDAAHARLKDTAPAKLAENFLTSFALPKGAIVSGYWPGRSEFDVRPLLTELAARGHGIALPVVVARGSPLRFRRWRPGDVLEIRAFGLEEPRADVPELVPSVLLVPYLAIDREGYRIGYGAGYYDLTLAALRARNRVLAIGVGYADQSVERLPRESFDEPLDALATEAGVEHFVRAANENIRSAAR